MATDTHSDSGHDGSSEVSVESATFGPDTQTYVVSGKEYELRPATVCSGIEIKPLYGPDDVAGIDYERDIGDPGSYPYTRGIHPTMYRSQLWTMRQYAGFGTGEDTNARFKTLLAAGQTGLSVAVDLPTQLGLDSDDPQAELEVGRVGVAIDTVDDLVRVFQDIDPGVISTSYTINATANILFAMHLVLAERHGVPWERVRGTIQNDPLKEYVARGNFIYPPEAAVALTADAIEFAMMNVPKFNAVSVSQSHIKEAGATNAFSLACAFANGQTYVDELIRRGHHIDRFGPNISFNLFGDMEFFENICQQRAGRRIWARLMREKYGATNDRAMKLRYSAGAGSGTSLTHTYPLLNIARLGFHCLMQVLGGTQAVGLQGYDEAYDIPSEEAARMSLLIQAVVAHELGVADVVDPLGGSYFVESLTNSMETKILAEMERIAEWGGSTAAIESGNLQREIARQSYEWQNAELRGERKVVGINLLQPEDTDDVESIVPFVFDTTTRDRQIQRLARLRESRDNEAVKQNLDELRRAASAGQNTMFPIIDCVRSNATVGEISKALVDVYGAFQEPVF
jgi:methylmalonyl-CoA mutase, N-terminal domain